MASKNWDKIVDNELSKLKENEIKQVHEEGIRHAEANKESAEGNVV